MDTKDKLLKNNSKTQLINIGRQHGVTGMSKKNGGYKNKNEIADLIIQQVKQEVKQEVKQHVKKEVKQEVKQEVKKEVKQEVNNKVINNVNHNTGDTKLTFIDLFCGVGGFHQALTDLGCKCVLACDIDKKCCEVYENNYGIKPIKDIKHIDEKNMVDFDILCGGFPCQPFSNGGNKKSFDDNRGLLFDEIMRIAKHKKPKFLFLENVKHILKVSDGKVFEYIKKRINDIGYKLQIFKMSPHNYGIPQQRERIFFVCVRNDIYEKFNDNDDADDADGLTSKIKLCVENKNLTMEDLVEKNVDSKYNIEPTLKNVLDAWDELIKQFDVGEKISPTILINDYFKNYTDEEYNQLASWRKDYMTKNKPLLKKYDKIIKPWYKKHKELLTKREIYGKLEWQTGVIKKNDSIYNYFIQMRQSGIRVKKNKYFPTLVAMVQTPIYGKYKRYITPRECARLQSFPDTFKLHENDRVVYKQMGNSVNVFNTYTVIKSTFKHYDIC